jgi:hypothetical protein
MGNLIVSFEERELKPLRVLHHIFLVVIGSYPYDVLDLVFILMTSSI